MLIPTNTPVTLSISGTAGSLWSSVTSLGLSTGVPEVEAAMRSSLANYGLTPVSGPTIAAGNVIPSPSWPFTGAVVVRPSYDVDDAALRVSVESALRDATGYAASASIQSVGDAADVVDPRAPTPSPLPQWLADSLHLLERDATWIAVGGVGLVALIVVVVAYGPNIKKLASVNL